MKKSFIAILCLLLFLCVGIAQAALAAEKVVRVLNKDGIKLDEYEGLAKAIEEASGLDNPTFVLLKTFPVGNNINMSNATLDMQGYGLTFERTATFNNVTIQNQGQRITIDKGAKVVLKNSNINLNEKFIEVKSGGTLIVDGSTIENGRNITYNGEDLVIEGQAYATNTAIKKAEGKGGAIYAQAGAKVTINNSTLRNNYANFGGAIFICGDDNAKNEAALEIVEGTFEYNEALKIQGTIQGKPTELPSRGGAIYICRNKAIIEKSVFTHNESYHGGGAIFIWGKSEDNGAKKAAQLEVYGTKFTYNKSGLRGGAITVSEFSSAKFDCIENNGDVTPTLFEWNSLTDARNFAGGALFIDRSFVYMGNVLIENNKARDAGGGISTCSTGTADIRPLQGVMILNNEVTPSGKVKNADKYPDVYFLTIDHLDYTNPDSPEYVDGRDRFSTIGLKYELHEQMFNYGSHNWKLHDFFTNKEETKDGVKKLRKLHSLIAKSYPEPVTGKEEAKVIFRYNEAVSSSTNDEPISGGAIADNGLLEIGSTTKIRILKVWQDANSYGIATRPSPDELLEKFELYENGKNGPSRSIGSLKNIKENKDSKIEVHVLTDKEEIEGVVPYSNVVFGKKSVIGEIYDINEKRWIVPPENVWVIDVEGLKGNPYGYTVKESAIEGYEQNKNKTSGTIFTNKLKYTNVTATKLWDHKDNDPSAYPEQVTFRLHANGVEIANKVVRKADDWKVQFDELPLYEGGEKIKYTITEDHVHDYTHHVDEKTLIVTNTYNPGKTDVEVEKEWEDNHDQYKIRPEQVTVHLYANGVNTGKQLILNAAKEWYGAFEVLDELDENGKKIAYTVVEDPVKGYVSSVTGDAEKGFTIVNTLDEHFTFTKVWIGGNENEISWKFFSQEEKPLKQRFIKKKLSNTEWYYESAEKVNRGTYLIEDPVPGYVTQYENVGIYAKVTDRLYSCGKILNVKVPQTGDKENLWVGIGLGALSLLGMTVLLRSSRKRRREK